MQAAGGAGDRGTAARDERGRSVVAVEALPKLSISAWDRFLRTLEGQPQ